MKANGESIYGTRGGPLAVRSWGATTQKAGKIYVHVLEDDGPLLALSGLPKLSRASVLASGATVPIERVKDGIVLRLPDRRDPSDTVILLETAR
jgi:alpha-L-fucosidase